MPQSGDGISPWLEHVPPPLRVDRIEHAHDAPRGGGLGLGEEVVGGVRQLADDAFGEPWLVGFEHAGANAAAYALAQECVADGRYHDAGLDKIERRRSPDRDRGGA